MCPIHFFAYLSSPDHTSVVTYDNCVTTRVVQRGSDWRWGDQDYQNGRPGKGVIKRCKENKWATVRWDNGEEQLYRIGAENSYDLIYTGNNKSFNT